MLSSLTKKNWIYLSLRFTEPIFIVCLLLCYNSEVLGAVNTSVNFNKSIQICINSLITELNCMPYPTSQNMHTVDIK